MLQARFGSGGEHLWNLAHGRDDRLVVPEREAKSISHETTFDRGIADLEAQRAWLVDLTDQRWSLGRTSGSASAGCRLPPSQNGMYRFARRSLQEYRYFPRDIEIVCEDLQ
jgi:nucleotidyltransferase/DNA polymerase involved in DNA repair